MCSAARAFELRWLFRAEESRFGNWRTSRYHLLDMDPAVLAEAADRVSSVQQVLGQILEEMLASTAEPPAGMLDATRLCVLEILKHLPVACLIPGLELPLLHKVQHLRDAPVSVSIRARAGREGLCQQLTARFRIDPSILGRADLVLVAYVTRYTVVKFCSLARMPDPGGNRITPEIADEVGRLANGYDIAPREAVRTELFALPGAWPFASTWRSNA